MLDEDSCRYDDSEGDTTTTEMDDEMDLADSDPEAEQENALSASIDDQGGIRIDFGYEMFTTEFDEVVRADELCNTEEMLHLRSLLDQQLVPFKHATSKLANRLQHRLLAKQNRTWEYELEEEYWTHRG